MELYAVDVFKKIWHNIFRGSDFYMKKIFGLLIFLLILFLAIVCYVFFQDVLPGIVVKHRNKVLIKQNKLAYNLVVEALEKVRKDTGLGMDYVFSPENSSIESAKAFAKYFKKAAVPDQAEMYPVKPMYPMENPETGELAVQMFGADRIELKNGIYLNVIQAGCVPMVTTDVLFNQDGSVKRDKDGNPINVEHISKRCAMIQVDVNGIKGPNQTGRDVFSFDVTREGYAFHYSVWYGNIQEMVVQEKFSSKLKDYDLNGNFGE